MKTTSTYLYYRILLTGLLGLTLNLLLSSNLKGQVTCPNSPSIAQEYNPLEVCSQDKAIWWQIAFTIPQANVDPTNFDGYFIFNWGDNANPALATESIFPATATLVPSTSNYRWAFANGVVPPVPYDDDKFAFFGNYPPDLGECEVTVTVQLRFVPTGEPVTSVNAVDCANLRDEKVSDYYSFDNEDPGQLNINPIEYLVCAGDEVTIQFNDATAFNCINAADTDNPNNSQRHVRWVYNVVNEATPGVGRIDNVVLNGAVTIDQGNPIFDDYIINTEAGQDVNGVENYPAPVVVASNVSQSVTLLIPGDAVADQIFEVRLDNWNPCNPYNPGDLNNPPPVSQYAIVRIVRPPLDLGFTISSDVAGSNLKTVFCPGEAVRFRGTTSNNPGGANAFQFRYEIYDGPDDTDPLVVTRNGTNVWMGVDNWPNGAGVKLIRMIVRNPNPGLTGTCESVFDRTITIIDTPESDIEVLDEDGDPIVFADPDNKLIEFCESELPLTLSFLDNSTGKSPETNTEWRLTHVNNSNANITPIESDPETIGGVDLVQVDDNSAYNPVGLQDYVFSAPGHYRLRLSVIDGNTDCSTTDVVNIIIYRNPDAVFSANEVCAGSVGANNRTAFSGISSPTQGLIPPINGDQIVLWEWDFNYDPVAGFNTAGAHTRVNENNFTRFLNGSTAGQGGGGTSVPGVYEVMLRVTTASGCQDSIAQLVTVYFNPNADLDSDYTDPICPGSSITFTNITDESLNDASVTDVTYQLRVVNTNTSTTTTTPIGAPGSTTPDDFLNVSFLNASGSTVIYEVFLDAVDDNSCSRSFGPIEIEVLGAPPSAFNVFEDDESTPYDNSASYCSPVTFYYQLDNNTANLSLDVNDSIVWTVTDGGAVIGGDTTYFTEVNFDNFTFSYENEGNTTFKTFLVTIQPYVNGTCVASSAREVKVLPKPSAEFNLIHTIETCDEVTYRFEAVQKGLTIYDWSTTPTAASFMTNITGDIIEFIFDRPDIGDPDLNFDVDLQTTNPFFCLSNVVTDNYTIDAKEDFNVILIADPDSTTVTNCLPTSYDFSNGTISGTYPPTTTWELVIEKRDNFNDWQPFQIINGADLGGNEEFVTPISFEFLQEGNYKVELIASPPSSCTVASTPPLYFTIHPVPTADFNINPNIGESCSDRTFTFTDDSDNNGATISQYKWTIYDPLTSTIVFADSGISLTSIAYELVNETDPIIPYQITLKLTTDQGCEDEITRTIDIWQKPRINFDVVQDVLCEDDENPQEYTFEFRPNTALRDANPPDTEYRWIWGNGQFTDVGTDLVDISYTYENAGNFSNPQTFNVRLEAITLDNCISDVTSKQVTLQPRVTANFVKNTEEGCSPLQVNFNYVGITRASYSYIYRYRLQGSGDPWELIDSHSSGLDDRNGHHIFVNESSGSDEVYEILLTVFNNIGSGPVCDDEMIDEVLVHSEYDSGEISGPDEVCRFAENIVFRVDPVYSGSKFEWIVPPGAFISSPDDDSNEIEVSFTTSDVVISVREINPDGCPGAEKQHAVNVLAAPTGQMFLDDPSPICYDESKTFRFVLNGIRPTSDNFDLLISVNGVEETIEDITVDASNEYLHTIHNFEISQNVRFINLIDRSEPYPGAPLCPEGLGTGNFNIQVYPEVTADISGNTLICEGSNTNITVQMGGRSPFNVWLTDGTDVLGPYTLNSNFGFINVDPLETTSYELHQVIDANGCEADASVMTGLVTITVSPDFDTPQIVPGNPGNGAQVCRFAENVVYSVENTAGSIYFWTVPDGAFVVSGQWTNEVEVNFSVNSGDITVIETNVDGCPGTPSVFAVEVLTGPSVEMLRVGPQIVCVGDETSFQFNLNGPGGGPYDVTWVRDGNVETLVGISDGHIETVTINNPNAYTVLSVVDQARPDCDPSSVTGNHFIANYLEVTANLSGQAEICKGQSTTLIATFTGQGPWNFVLEDDFGATQNLSTASAFYAFQVSPEQSTDYRITAVSGINCVAEPGNIQGVASVIVNELPEVVLSGDQTACLGDPVTLSFQLRGESPWTIRYTNGTNNFTIPNINAPAGYDPDNDTYMHEEVVFPQVGSYTYSMIDIRDNNVPQCLGGVSGTANVVINPLPLASISGSTSICVGDATDIVFNLDVDGPYDVIYTDGTTDFELGQISNGHTITVAPETSTTYSLVEVANSNGCEPQMLGESAQVVVNAIPTVAISGEATICYGENFTVNFQMSGQGPWTVVYGDSEGNVYEFETNFNTRNEVHTPTTSRTYEVISISDSNNPVCTNTSGQGVAEVNVFPELVASFTATPTEMTLPNSTVQIVNNTTNPDAWEFSWDFGDGNKFEGPNPGSYDYGFYGEYTIRMTATNGQCTANFEETIMINAIPPVVDFVADPEEGCNPLLVTFDNLTQFAQPGTYLWEFGDGQRSTLDNPTHTYVKRTNQEAETFTVTLSANNVTGQRMFETKTAYITVYATPIANFSVPPGSRVTFSSTPIEFINLSEGADDFYWEFGDGNISYDREPVHAYADSGIFDITLVAINTNTGCTDTVTLDAQVKVELGGEAVVPNAFTPSRAGPGTGDPNPQTNDFFLPEIKGVSQFNMKIYNRWGELLFESNSREMGWDGYYKGRLMPQDVYVYRLDLVYDNGRKETKIGDVTLIR